MSSDKVLLGTDYVRAQNELQNTEIALTPSLCSSLSTFKSLLRTSRSLDDSIPLRLNRSSALSSSTQLTPAACEAFWGELRHSWEERGKLIGYCESAMRPERKEVVRENVEDRLAKGREQREEDEGRRGRGESEREVKRRQIVNELQVESIIRNRSLAMFMSRCPYTAQEPPAAPLPVSLEDELEREERLKHRGRDGRGGVRWNG